MKLRETAFAKDMYRSIARAISGSLERGEMEKFTKLLVEQKKIEGLLEFSLYDIEGKVTHSSDVSYIGKTLPPENKEKLYSDPQMLLLWKKEAIEIYKPQEIKTDCIRCHTNWKLGQIGGILGFRFSTKALSNAETQGIKIISNMKRSALTTSILSLLGIYLF